MSRRPLSGKTESFEGMINKYLLGDLPEKEQVAIENAAFEDEQQLQAIQEAESDLIDEYIRGELSDRDRRLFEKRFFASAERRRKIEFAKALSAVAPEFQIRRQSVAVTEKVGWRDALRAFFSSLPPVPRFALAAATILLIIGGAWLTVETLRLRSQVLSAQAARQKQEQELQRQINLERERSEQLSAELKREQQQRQQSEQVLNQLERIQESKAVEPQPAIATLALLAGIPRGGSAAHPKLQLPQTTRLVRLQVEIDPADEFKSYRVDLHDRSAGQVWTRAGLATRTQRAGKVIIVTLPATLLRSQQYELSVKGVSDQGTTQDLGYYYFDVVKK